LRGSRDGFSETVVFNTALIRRRIRDPRLTFEKLSVGESSKTDVALGYIDGVADPKLVGVLREKIKALTPKNMVINQQNLVELLLKKPSINPFPKVRYT
ncbi:spore germination protein, partial [Bittarella massiliensis (ex Durand et al. 2017)]